MYPMASNNTEAVSVCKSEAPKTHLSFFLLLMLKVKFQSMTKDRYTEIGSSKSTLN